jgi:hypothetical protein
MELFLPDLRLYLTDGFAGDHVVVSVNGRVIFDERGITTKKLYGLAHELEPVQMPGNSAKVEVNLPDKNLAATLDVDLNKGSHVVVSVVDNRLRLSVHKQVGFM